MTHARDTFSTLDFSNVPDGGRLLQRYGMWFEQYPQYAKESVGQRLADQRQFLGAWFELVLHELFVQIGCDAEVKDVDSKSKSPDFLVVSSERSCYVEATTVNPRDNPLAADLNLEDAISKLNTLESSDFQILLTIEGKIARTLSKGELVGKFGKLLSDHDLVAVHMRVQAFGEESAPSVEIREENWCLRGELQPILQKEKVEDRPRGLLVGPMGSFCGDASPEVQEAVSKKAKKYASLDKPLIVAVNVLDVRFDREAEVAALFGQEQIRYFPNRPDIPVQLIRKPPGVWVKGGYEARYTRLAGVIMFNGFFPLHPQGSICLYPNPYICKRDLPELLYKLPHAKYEGGCIDWIQGTDISDLLDIP